MERAFDSGHVVRNDSEHYVRPSIKINQSVQQQSRQLKRAVTQYSRQDHECENHLKKLDEPR